MELKSSEQLIKLNKLICPRHFIHGHTWKRKKKDVTTRETQPCDLIGRFTNLHFCQVPTVSFVAVKGLKNVIITLNHSCKIRLLTKKNTINNNNNNIIMDFLTIYAVKYFAPAIKIF